MVIDHPDAAAATSRWNDLLGGSGQDVHFTGATITFRQTDAKLARIAEIGVRGWSGRETIAGTLFRGT